MNRETDDYSLPYMIARSRMDGPLYLDSFTPEKFMDPAVRRLMDKITVAQNPRCVGLGPYRLTVRTKSGGELVKEWLPAAHEAGNFNTPMSDDEITAKYNRACAFMHIADEQRDRARIQWSNLRAIKDIAEPMRTLAKFGKPLPL